MIGFLTKESIIFTFLSIVIIASLWFLNWLLMPFVFAFVVAYLFNPLVVYLEKHKIPRALSSAMIVLLFFSVCIFVLLLLIPFIADSANNIFGSVYNGWNTAKDFLQEFFEDHITTNNSEHIIIEKADQIINFLSSKAANMFLMAFDSSIKIFNSVLFIILAPIITFYFIKDWNFFTKHSLSLIPRGIYDKVFDLLQNIDKTVSSYIRGQIKVCIILSVVYSILLFIAGLKHALLFGILMGLSSFIPYIGSMVVFTSVFLYSLGQFSDLFSVFFTIFLLFIGQIIDSAIVTPKIIGSSLDLGPNWIIAGIVICSALFGFFGTIFSMPIVAIFSVIIKRLYNAYIKSSFYNLRIDKINKK